MPEVIDYRFRLRRALAATWTSLNDVLLDGEIGLERDTLRWKVGDGSTGWNALDYQDGALKLEYFDVDTTDRDDGKALLWDDALGKHVYGDVAAGGGGGGGGGGSYEFVSEVIVTTAQQDIDFSSLDLDADAEYVLKIYAVPSVTTAHTISLYYNGDTTAANYQRIAMLSGTANNVSTGRANDAYILYAAGAVGATSDVLAGRVLISKASGLKPLACCVGNSYTASSSNILTFTTNHIRNNTANVTSIKLRHGNNFGVGTRVRLYKLTKFTRAGSQVGYARATSATSAATTSAIPLDASKPQITEGDAYASLDTTITPKAASSLLEIEVIIPWVTASAAAVIVGALFRDSGVDAIGVGIAEPEAADRLRPLTVRAVVAAGSTSATTFKLRWGVSTGTGYLLRNGAGSITFGGAAAATMTVKEIAQ